MNNFFFRNYLVIFIFFFGIIIFVLECKAEEPKKNTGFIVGRVIDSETGEALRSTTVQVKNTKLGGFSDVKGDFKIRNIPEGTYTIKFTYLSHTPVEVTNVVVRSGEETKLPDIVLNPEIHTTEEVVVSADMIYDNQASVLALRRNAEQVSDGISIEEIKKLPDSDAGQALRRVSGITLVADKYVYVRGVSERYSNTTLNGASLATTEPDKKAFAFDMFPAEFLENANIVKSFTPDLPGNFAGGLVQLNTVDFPSKSGFRLSIGSSANSSVTMKDNAFITYHGGNTDWLGFDDGSRSMPADIPKTPTDMSSLLFKDLKSGDLEVKNAAIQKWIKIGQGFNDNLYKNKNETAMPNGNISLSYSDVYNIADNDFGLVFSGMYNNSFSVNDISRATLLSNGEYRYHGAGSQSTYSTNLGGIFNLAYKIGTRTSISLKNTFNNSSDDEMISLEGRKEENYLLQKSSQFVQKTLFSTQLTGEHSIFSINSKLNWNIGYSKSLRDEPDLRRYRYSRNDTTQPYYIDIYSNPQGNGALAGRFFSNLEENSFSSSFDWTIPLSTINIKFGALFEQKNRDFKVRSFTIIQANTILKTIYNNTLGYDESNKTDPAVLATFTTGDPATVSNPYDIFSSDNFGIHGLAISEDTQIRDSYKALENLNTGYLMAEIPIFIRENKIRIITGVRLENSIQNLNSLFPFYNSETDSYYDSTYVKKNYVDWLPSLNLIFELSKKINIRMSATRTLTRPSLREYAPFTFYDFKSQMNVKGKPSLVEANIQNYDLRWEMFPNPGEVLSVSAFYKIFNNAIEETILQTSGEIERTFSNAEGKAYNYGIELEARKNLGFLSTSLSSFNINFNLALINSIITVKQAVGEDTRSMWGQSPYSLNIGLYYVQPDWGTNISLAYNTFGRRIIQVADINTYQFKDPHVYEVPRNVVDFSISQVLTNNIELKFMAKDLLNEDLIWEQGGYKTQVNHYGRIFSLSIGYKL